MKKNNYFSEQDFLGFLSEHRLTVDTLSDPDTGDGYRQFTDLDTGDGYRQFTDPDTGDGYRQFMDPEHAEKSITFVSRTVLLDEEENEKE